MPPPSPAETIGADKKRCCATYLGSRSRSLACRYSTAACTASPASVAKSLGRPLNTPLRLLADGGPALCPDAVIDLVASVGPRTRAAPQTRPHLRTHERSLRPVLVGKIAHPDAKSQL